MKRFTILLSTFFFTLIAFSQDLDEVLESHFEAIGQDKIVEIEAFEFKSQINRGSMEIPLIIYQSRPNMYKSIAEVQGMRIISAFDGENGWMINPTSGTSDPTELSGDQLKSIRDRADIDGKLYNWKEKGHKLEFIGTEEMEGTEVYVLEMETKIGDKVTYYIDTDSHLILKEVNKMMVQGAENEIATVFSNYKEAEGIIFPYSFTMSMGEQTIMSMTIEEVILNPDMDEYFFKMPEVKKVEPAPELEENK